MKHYKYMRLRLDILPQEISDKYKLTNIVHANGWVYVNIWKGMYGLPQASILANKLCQHIPGLWHHMWHYITFCLNIDNFGIKMSSMADMKHLVTSLKNITPS